MTGSEQQLRMTGRIAFDAPPRQIAEHFARRLRRWAKNHGWRSCSMRTLLSPAGTHYEYRAHGCRVLVAWDPIRSLYLLLGDTIASKRRKR